MRGLRIGMRLAGALALLVLAGCHAPETIKPPLHEEYVLPPSDDARFSSPPNYPKEALDNGMPKKDSGRPGEPPRMPGAGFGTSGMGRMGGY